MKLLLIEDDVILGEGLRDYLEGEGHQLDWARSLRDTLRWSSQPHEVLIVDWQLPDGSGVDYVQAQRQRGDDRPMVMLTARDRLEDRVAGFQAGADDYVIKPFEPLELASRLQAIWRRCHGGSPGGRRFGDVQVDPQAQRAYILRECGRSELVSLTRKEWEVLEFLVLRAGRVVEKCALEAMLSRVEGEVGSNLVEVYVANLRRKLGRRLIETVRGTGYRIQHP